MPWLKVHITGEGLEQVRAALNGANIPTIGPLSQLGYSGSTEPLKVGNEMLAVLDADSPDEAVGHVRDNLQDGDYTVGPTEPWGD
jgi:hypothetical protein